MAEGRDEWVARVLGVPVPRAGAARHGDIKLLPVWQEGKARIDAQLAGLAASFAAQGDALGVAIAEQGLPAVTGKLFVGLVAAMFDHDGAPAARRGEAREKVMERLAGFRASLEPGGLWAALDANPFGARAGLCATVGGVLEGIERALA